jgi:uncharacterized membrane protein YkvA (DUF1232 family)
MSQAEETMAVLQRFVDGYREATETAMQALADPATPAPAKRLLCGALNYGLDVLDMFPDHFQGLGVADDAMLLRVAARQAVAAGASQPRLKALADEAPEVEPLLGDLATPLETYVTNLPSRAVRGRTADQILASKDVLAVFSADIQRQIAGYKPQQIDPSVKPEWQLKELRNMLKHYLKKSGL